MRGVQGAPEPIKVQDVRKALRAGYAAYTRAFMEKLEGHGDGALKGVYFRMASHPLGRQPKYLAVHLPLGVLQACLRFRLGAHHLEVTNHAVAYGHRLCHRCTAPARGIDTECHCLLRCADPDIVVARVALQAAAFPAGLPTTVRGLFSPPGGGWGALRRVVLYVVHCSKVVDQRRAVAEQQVPLAPVPLQLHPDDALWADMFDSSDEEELGIVGGD
jgi:hypothetical protein